MSNVFRELQVQQKLQAQPKSLDPLTGGFVGDTLRGGIEPSPILEPFAQQEKESEGFSTKLLKAAFATENTIGSLIADNQVGNIADLEEDPDFDVLSQVEGTDYEPYLDSFEGVFNQAQFDNIVSKIDKEKQNRQIIADAGGAGIVVGITAGIFDPVNLIPIGGSTYKAFKAGKIAEGAFTGAQVGALSVAASESLLQSTQELRTIEESTFNVAGGAVLGGLLGGLAGKLSAKQFDDLAQRVENDIQRQESQIQIDNDGNLSAAKVQRTTLNDETLAGGKITQGVIKSTKKLNPMLRILDGSSLTARRLVPRLVRTNMFFKKNADDIATDQSVEIAVKQWDAGLGKAIQSSNILAKKAAARFKREGSKISKERFNDEVALAMIRGDKSDIAEVAQAAAAWRREVFDPLKNEAIAQKILPEDVKPETAASYMMRQYNVRKIISQEQDFKEIIKTGARERLIPEIKGKLSKAEQKLAAKELEALKLERRGIEGKMAKATDEQLAKLQDRRIELDILVGDEVSIADYVDEIADSVFDNIVGTDRKGVSMPYDIKIGVRGPAKERVLTFVKDEEIRSFLETDIEKLAKNYTRTMSTDVELVRSFGNLDLEPQLREIKDEFKGLRKKAKTEKEAQKLAKEEEDVIRIVEAFKDMLRGHYGRPNDPDSFWPRAARISRLVQYMSKLGGVTISSIPDIGRHVMVHGLSKTFGVGIKSLFTNAKGIKLAVADAREAGNILEAVTHQRAALMADLGDPYASGTQFERMLSWMGDNFSKFSLLDYWNNYQKSFASVLTQQRMIENISSFGKIKTKEKRYLAFLGIDSNSIEVLQKQLKKHGTKEEGLFIANLAKWDDQEAARIYKNALNTDVDRTIVTKGVGDTPLLMNTELGKTIGQFKSFAFAAHQQVLIAGLQQKDAAALSGVIASITMGMMTYYLKQIAAGREVTEEPEILLAEGVDRSGLLPVIAEMNGVADVFGFGAGTLTGQQPLSRFATRNKVGGLLGPSFGGVVDTATSTRAAVDAAISDGEMKESDIRAMRKNLPYQNIFYLRWLFNEAEKNLNN